ncbi:YciI family protein [Anaerotignum sp.]|uniref:YciI family protein n=1 Tax=Anaerotignum sp. TaxID=2039241 RepID=UPI0028AD36CE|nr:YciI family protein [Anaerotignum sp.]
MFLVILSYKKTIEHIEKALSDHILFLDKYYENKKFIVSGRRNPRVGGVILVNSNSTDEVMSIIQEDPFNQNDLVDYEIIEFIPTKFDERFSEFLI